eukprot:scpid52798/ scgid26791/ Mitogen-activated protein kinase 6
MDTAEGFSNVKLLASGGYGRVFSAREEFWERKSRSSRSVVIKTMGRLHHGYVRMSAFRELFILSRLQPSPFIVNMYSSFAFVDQTSSDVTSLHVTLEKMDMDVGQLLRMAKRGPRSGLGVRWSDEDWSSIGLGVVHSVLSGLEHIHSTNVLHRDIKPGNILVNVDNSGRPTVVKIADFGLARAIDGEYSHDGYLTHAVSTRWYRAPELLLDRTSYTSTVDIWSTGCILAEFLLHGVVLFCGSNDTDQLHRICNLMGLPGTSDLPGVTATVNDGPEAVDAVDGGLQCLLPPHITAEEMSLLTSLLTFDGTRRPSASEVLEQAVFKSRGMGEECDGVQLRAMHIEDEALCLLARSADGFVDALCTQDVQFRCSSSADSLASLTESLASFDNDDNHDDDNDDAVFSTKDSHSLELFERAGCGSAT